jgi:hypothetical protein
MKVLPITQEDLVFINEEIKPKNKRALIHFAIFFILFAVFAPFIPGRNVRVSSFSSPDYLSAFLFYTVIICITYAYLIYKDVYCLNKDLQDGEKLVLQLKVIRAATNRYAQNELILERPKSPSFNKIYVAKENFGLLASGDTAIVEILVRSGTVLSYEKA